MTVRQANLEKKPLPCLRCGREMRTDRCHRICRRCRRHRIDESIRRPLALWLAARSEQSEISPSVGR